MFFGTDLIQEPLQMEPKSVNAGIPSWRVLFAMFEVIDKMQLFHIYCIQDVVIFLILGIYMNS